MKSLSLRATVALGVIAAGAAIAVASLGTFASAQTGGPGVTLASTTTSPTNAASIPVTATFSESVSGFGTSSITATNATVANFSGRGAHYSFNINPTTDGTTTVAVTANMASSTASSTDNQASNILTFLSDRTAPTIATIVGVPATTTNTTVLQL